MGQLADWRKGTQRKGKDHVAAIDDLAMSLGMGTLGKVKYSVIVRQAGDKTPVGGARALTHWRECSAFAHGSYWGSLFLNDNTFVEELRGGAAFRSALDEKVHAKACATALMVLQAGVDSWERHTRPTA